MVRTGIGFDVHKLVAGRKLILGGVEIQYPKGLAGHSDADVICHAIADALLGATGMGDIGLLFPDSNPELEGISSLQILSEINRLLCQEKYKTVSIDVTVVAQEPRIASYVGRMKSNIAGVLGITATSINIKGKTTEGLGFIGQKEGIAAISVATVAKYEL
ncbi:MAG: 2-C-methyl-D-erythritol 2,4-cyclodiphosphate synthase [candidate division Zixibacteria bacterium 4484_95]|nr:MAG: 2-C-methyl-D-erythritol 2,4-cyclodiphosphate synthase [candidate division Zixibacteria bacterium 4484_95]RKX19431.1 MAG: 2-C-methyl-D-erythritol 2,4-cyclodiphosphate synthase [candidate division Zixibacteria bacterium]